MQKWEYVYIKFIPNVTAADTIHLWPSEAVDVDWMNDAPNEPKLKISLARGLVSVEDLRSGYIASTLFEGLGQKGWEPASISVDDHAEVILFKRPIEG